MLLHRKTIPRTSMFRQQPLMNSAMDRELSCKQTNFNDVETKKNGKDTVRGQHGQILARGQ